MERVWENFFAALGREPSLAEAHTSLAQITAVNDHDWEAAEKEYKRALELRPSYSTGHHYYATFLMSMGRHAEALQEMEQAQKLDPLSPIIATFIGRAHYFAGRNQDSIAQYKKILASDPNFPVARTYLIQSEEQAGDFQEALHQAQAFASQTAGGDSQIRKLRLAWQADGERGYWKEMLRQRLRQRGGMGDALPHPILSSPRSTQGWATTNMLSRCWNARLTNTISMF